MNIREFAEENGISTAAVYKKLKGKGLNISALKDQKTGDLTPGGLKVLEDLFNPASQELTTAQRKIVEELTTEVDNLKAEITRLTTELSEAKEQIKALEDDNRIIQEREKMVSEERDNLRQALDRSQQLEAMALQKIPAALPAPEHTPWYRRIFGKGKGADK